MLTHTHIITTKLKPFRLHRHALTRSRLTARLSEALEYPLTILHAGTGFGKTTALAQLNTEPYDIVWYHLDREDTDPFIFLLHLTHGFAASVEGIENPLLPDLTDWEAINRTQIAADALINWLHQHLTRPILLILDDAHLLDQSAETLRIMERLIAHQPAQLHILLSCRQAPSLNSLITHRVRGELLEIGQSELAFTPDEIAALFWNEYGTRLNPAEIALLSHETEGWAIALQLIWQGFSRHEAGSLAQALQRFSGLKGDLFAYLAQEVLNQQPPEIQQFLRITSVLREMTPALCDDLCGASDSHAVLRSLVDSGLFVVELGDDRLRYHLLFHEFLQDQFTPLERESAHRKAALWLREAGQGEETIYHFMQAGDHQEAAEIIQSIGRGMVRAGRLETLAGMISVLSPRILDSYPILLTYLGDIARLHSRFNEALRWYQKAEERCRQRGNLAGIAQSLRGQARVYLDTVNPAMAETPLREALRLSDGQVDRESHAALLEMLAENQLNLGRTEEASQLQDQARQLREEGPGEAELDLRVLLRTGRLALARSLLEEQVEIEQKEPVLRPRAHRETLLLLSLIEACLGAGELAYRHALEGTERGHQLDSPFVTAVGYMRQGHALLISDLPDALRQARANFDKAISLSEKLQVSRLKVEANWGLCRAYGFESDLASAEVSANRGIEIAQEAGDEWISAHIRLAMGSVFALVGQFDPALEWLSQAEVGFRECSDPFGVATVRLWQCIVWQEQGDQGQYQVGLDDLMQRVQSGSYDFLLTQRTLVGPPDPRRIAPLLIASRAHPNYGGYMEGLLRGMGLAGIEHHPGYQLRVQTLGAFRMWLGKREISPADWQRDKARQLFQLLITQRRTMLERDKICDLLWPDLTPDAAQRDFKVALNALYNTLEPRRESGAASAYVVRNGTLYGLRAEADIALDVDAFEKLIKQGDTQYKAQRGDGLDEYRQAAALYQGDYLAEYPYAEWCDQERERLRNLYLHSADRLAQGLIDGQDWDGAIRVSQVMLTYDNCWENAYRMMMIAHTRMGNRAQALRLYQVLMERLRSELNAEPSPESEGLYHLIAHSSLPDLPSQD